VDLEKAFDRVPRQVIRWAMHKLGVEEWSVSAVMSMYTGAKTVVEFCYLPVGDMLSVDGDADASVEAKIRIGMRVNMNQTNVMIRGERQKPVQKAARWPCGLVVINGYTRSVVV